MDNICERKYNKIYYSNATSIYYSKLFANCKQLKYAKGYLQFPMITKLKIVYYDLGDEKYKLDRKIIIYKFVDINNEENLIKYIDLYSWRYNN